MINDVKEKIKWIQNKYENNSIIRKSYNLPGIGNIFIDTQIDNNVEEINKIVCDFKGYWFNVFRIIGIMNDIIVEFDTVLF